MRPSREREQTLLADWFNAVHYDGELPDWTEADPGDDEDEAVVAGARPVDGDGDGFVYDGTPRQRPWNPVTDASYPDGKIPEVVRKRQSVARQKARTSPFTPVDQSGELGGAATVPASPVKLTTKINTLTPDFTPEQSEKFAAFLTRQTGMTQYASDKYLPTNVRGFAQGYSTREWLDPLFTSDSPDPDAVALVQAWRKALVDHIGEKGGDAAILHRGVIDKDTDPFVPKRTPHWSDQYNDVRPQPRDAEIAGITSWTSVKTQAKEFGGHNVTRDVPVDQLIGRFGSIAGEVLVADDPLVTRALDAWPNDVDGVPAAPFGTFPERYREARGAVPEAPTDIAFYEVGGAVRDDVMGIPTDDVDFAVTAPSYEAMKAHLEGQGFRIFQEREEFATIKAKVPDGHPLQKRTLVADFVLARRDGPSSDGRRPDYTEPGSLEDDLARRDFTVNAIAKDIDGNIIDPHNGLADIESRTLRFVGDPMARVNEDGLRVLRGFRFMVTKQLTPDPETWRALTSDVAVERLAGVSDNRVAKELDKMLAYDTPGAVHLLGQLPPKMLDAIFRDGMRLTSNQKKVKGLTRDLDLPRNPFIPTGDGESVIELGSGPEGWQRIPEPPGPAIPIQRDGLPARKVDGWKRPTSGQLAEAFNFELPSGYKVTAPAIRVTQSQVDAKIVGPDGKQVGRMTWQIREASPTAYLFSISINRGQQGNGIGAQVFARSVDNLRALGIDTVEALALSDDNHNGAYTWARAGFDWEPGDWSISELGEKLNAVSWDRKGEYPEADLMEARRIGRQLAAIDELPYDPEDYPETLPTPNDIAMIGWTPGAESWLGRDFLSGELVPEDDRLGSVVWSGVMRIGAAPSSPFAADDAPGELGSASGAPFAPWVDDPNDRWGLSDGGWDWDRALVDGPDLSDEDQLVVDRYAARAEKVASVGMAMRGQPVDQMAARRTVAGWEPTPDSPEWPDSSGQGSTWPNINRGYLSANIRALNSADPDDPPDPDAVRFLQLLRRDFLAKTPTANGTIRLYRGADRKGGGGNDPARYSFGRTGQRAESGVTSWTAQPIDHSDEYGNEWGRYLLVEDVPYDRVIGRFGSITGEILVADTEMIVEDIEGFDANPFATTDAPGELGSASVPDADVELTSIVRTGNPHRWNTDSGLDSERTYYASGDLSKRTVNARVAAIKKLMADELPQLKGKNYEIRYWTDWDEYKNAVWPSNNSGSYPLAAWRDNGGSEGGPAVWVSPSIATSWFDDDPATITNWKVLVHELVHAASPQRVSNSGSEAVLEEGMAEILSTDITARRIAEARVPYQQHRFDGGGTVPGVERLVRQSVYKERVAQLILHAADEVGEWDRDRIMAKMREWWDDGEYASKYRRYERRGDARTREEVIEAETVKINKQYDDLIARLPQHAEEYEKNRRDLIEHLDTLYSEGNWQATTNANWERMVASAEAAGVNVRRIVHTRNADYYQYESPPFDLTPEQHADADTVSDSLLYWLINGEAIDTAVSEAGAVAAEGPIAP